MLEFWFCAHYIKKIYKSCVESTETHTQMSFNHLFTQGSAVVCTSWMISVCACVRA